MMDSFLQELLSEQQQEVLSFTSITPADAECSAEDSSESSAATAEEEEEDDQQHNNSRFYVIQSDNAKSPTAPASNSIDAIRRQKLKLCFGKRALPVSSHGENDSSGTSQQPEQGQSCNGKQKTSRKMDPSTRSRLRQRRRRATNPKNKESRWDMVVTSHNMKSSSDTSLPQSSVASKALPPSLPMRKKSATDLVSEATLEPVLVDNNSNSNVTVCNAPPYKPSRHVSVDEFDDIISDEDESSSGNKNKNERGCHSLSPVKDKSEHTADSNKLLKSSGLSPLVRRATSSRARPDDMINWYTNKSVHVPKQPDRTISGCSCSDDDFATDGMSFSKDSDLSTTMATKITLLRHCANQSVPFPDFMVRPVSKSSAAAPVKKPCRVPSAESVPFHTDDEIVESTTAHDTAPAIPKLKPLNSQSSWDQILLDPIFVDDEEADLLLHQPMNNTPTNLQQIHRTQGVRSMKV